MMRMLTIVLSTISILLLGSCSNLPPGLDDANGLSTGSGDYSVTITNSTAETICYIFISSSQSDSWDSDFLTETQALAYHSKFTVRLSESGLYDIMVLPCNDNLSEEDALDMEYNLQIDGDIDWIASQK